MQDTEKPCIPHGPRNGVKVSLVILGNLTRMKIQKRQTPRKSRGYDESCHVLAQILLSGGGGNRTRVPRYFRVRFYVRSRVI